jgi:hypothetical protein
MHKNLLFIFNLFACTICQGQNFTGQWKGEFLDKSSIAWDGDKCDYVLELEVSGTKVSGFSYTYFSDAGKKFYTICRLEGYIDKKKKYLEVKEIQRTKTNVPREIRNCFQIHRLFYTKLGNNEQIEGNWIPAPNQNGDCGYGTTVLSRRSLINSYPGYQNTSAKSASEKKNPASKGNPTASVSKSTHNGSTKQDNKTAKNAEKLTKQETVNSALLIPEEKMLPNPDVKNRAVASGNEKLEKRVSKVIKTIEARNKTVRVDLYDNGEIDGDSVSLFFNGKLLLSNKRLTTRSLSLNLQIDENRSINELVMYAENLGTIPPNTALMVVTDGSKRYEVRITSDLQKSGTINFVYKPDEIAKP